MFGVDNYPVDVKNKSPLKILEAKENGELILDLPGVLITDEFKDVLRLMLKGNPKERITWKELYNHQIIKQSSFKVSVLNEPINKFSLQSEKVQID